MADDVAAPTGRTGRTIGVIIARGTSSGIVGKNTRLLGGVPLIEWTLAPARAACDIVILESDDDEILRIGVDYGAAVHREPAMLASGRVGDLPVVLDAYKQVEQYPDDIIVLLRPTAPFRKAEEITEVVEILRANVADSVRSVVPAEAHPAKSYLEVGWTVPPTGRAWPILESGTMRQVLPIWPILEPATIRHRANHPRQWLQKAWRACGFIDCVRADVLIGMNSLEGDVILGWPAPTGRATIEMDAEQHFLWAEAMAHENGWKPGEIS